MKLGPFVGSAVMTAVIAGLAAWLGVFVINRLTQTSVPQDYWVRHGVAPTMLSTTTAVTFAAAFAIVGAGAMWLLLMITPQAQTFFNAIAVLVGAIATVVTLAAHPWQESLGQAALVAAIAMIIATLTPRYTRLTTTTPEWL